MIRKACEDNLNNIIESYLGRNELLDLMKERTIKHRRPTKKFNYSRYMMCKNHLFNARVSYKGALHRNRSNTIHRRCLSVDAAEGSVCEHAH